MKIQMNKGKPETECSCLVRRNLYGQIFYEILWFDGSYWVTGLHDNPDAMIDGVD